MKAILVGQRVRVVGSHQFGLTGIVIKIVPNGRRLNYVLREDGTGARVEGFERRDLKRPTAGPTGGAT